MGFLKKLFYLILPLILIDSKVSAQDAQSSALLLPYYGNYASISAHELHTGVCTGITIKQFVSVGVFGSVDHINKELYGGFYGRSKLIRNPYVEPAVSIRVGKYADYWRGALMIETLIPLGKYVRLEPVAGINWDVFFGEIRIVISKYE